MTKRMKLGLGLAAVLILATGAFLYFRATEKPITVKGQPLSAKDITAIKRIVHHEIWYYTFSNFSFKTFRYLPTDIKRGLTFHIDSIESFDTSADPVYGRRSATANVTYGKSKFGGSYVCVKSTNQWILVKMVLPD
ncbi:hypothetical protein [Pedosphaera parvula]|nr:hypothetical protein [Pedosphaera parvula]